MGFLSERHQRVFFFAVFAALLVGWWVFSPARFAALTPSEFSDLTEWAPLARKAKQKLSKGKCSK